jgi:hypothetical protein
MFNSTCFSGTGAGAEAGPAIDSIATTTLSRLRAFTYLFTYIGRRLWSFPTDDVCGHTAADAKAGGPELFSFSQRIPLFTHQKAREM